jgi:hypothetical protein
MVFKHLRKCQVVVFARDYLGNLEIFDQTAI